MGRTDAVVACDEFYCYSLAAAAESDERDIMAFEPVDPKGAGLVAYLQRRAFADEEAGEMRTYLVRDRLTDELAGYFSLKAGLMTRDEVGEEGRVRFDTSPGIELANFAMNGAHRDRHPSAKGAGKLVFNELVLGIVRRAAGLVGVSVVYLFALPDERVVANYERYGFSRLAPAEEKQLHSRIKPRYDDQCVFMVMRLA